MATAAPARKKKKGRSRKEMLERFNKFIDDVFTAGPRFSMKALEDFEREAIAAREILKEEVPLEEMTPRKKSELEEFVFKRVEAMGKLMISKHMTEEGLHAALDLADILEKAAKEQGMDMDFGQWVKS